MAVGVRRLELPTSTSRTWRAANCATPRSLAGLFQAHKGKQIFSIPQIKFSYSEFRSLIEVSSLGESRGFSGGGRGGGWEGSRRGGHPMALGRKIICSDKTTVESRTTKFFYFFIVSCDVLDVDSYESFYHSLDREAARLKVVIITRALF